MKPVPPPQRDGAIDVVIGRGSQYDVLPANVSPDGMVLTEWEPSALDRIAIARGGRIRLWVHTHHRPFAPVALEAVRSDGSCVDQVTASGLPN